jgi:HK97 family phage major capsid protein
MTLQELRDARNRVAQRMRDMHAAAETENRGFSAEERGEWERLVAEHNSLEERIAAAEQVEHANRRDPAQVRAGGGRAAIETPGIGHNGGPGLDEMRAFRSWLTRAPHLTRALTDEDRAWMQTRMGAVPEDALAALPQEQRDFAIGAGNAGGFTVPQDFFNSLEVAMRDFGAMLRPGVAQIIRTDSGAPLPMPTFNYTAVVATIIGEGTAIATDTSTPFGSTTLGGFMYAPPILPISIQFLQDTAFDEAFIVNAMGEALGRGMNAHFTTGTGTGQPRGLMVAATIGRTGATGNATSISYNELLLTEHSVDPAYRIGAQWMFHDSTLRILKGLVDTQNRPLFLPTLGGIAGAAPATIMGYPYVINQDVAVMAANARSIAFGRLDKYKIRLVRQVQVLRLSERYADRLQVGFVAFLRGDGNLLDAGTNPVRLFQNSAT